MLAPVVLLLGIFGQLYFLPFSSISPFSKSVGTHRTLARNLWTTIFSSPFLQFHHLAKVLAPVVLLLGIFGQLYFLPFSSISPFSKSVGTRRTLARNLWTTYFLPFLHFLPFSSISPFSKSVGTHRTLARNLWTTLFSSLFFNFTI